MIITVGNQKGGVGKTTLAIHLAWFLQKYGKTCLIDTDAQGTATRAVGLEITEQGIYDALVGSITLDKIWRNSPWGFDVASATPDLAYLSSSELPKYPYTLKNLFQHSSYKFIVIDTAPGLGIMSQTALVAADLVLLVSEPNYFSGIGLIDVLGALDVIKEEYNPRMEQGLVINKIAHTNENATHVKNLKEVFDIWAQIPHRAAIQTSAGLGAPCDQISFQLAMKDIVARIEKISREIGE